MSFTLLKDQAFLWKFVQVICIYNPSIPKPVKTLGDTGIRISQEARANTPGPHHHNLPIIFNIGT